MTELPESEHAVLGSLLLDPSLHQELSLTPEDFGSQSSAMVFETVTQMIDRGEVIDAFTVGAELDRVTSSKNRWIPYLTSLYGNFGGTPKNIKSYEKILKQESRERRIMAICEDLKARMRKDGEQAVDDAIGQFMALNAVQEKYTKSSVELTTEALREVEAAFEGKDLGGLSTGLKELDEGVGGLRTTELIICASRPAMGKTALMLNMSMGHNAPTLIFSSEQRGVEVGKRFFSIVGNIDSGSVRTGQLKEDDWPRLISCVNQLKTRNLWVNDKSGIHISEIVRQARQWRYKYNIEVIYVDYLQRLEAPGKDDRERVKYIAKALKNLAKELNIAVLALAQVNRNCELRSDKRPTMADIADCSEIEKEADIIFTLYRDEVYNQETDRKGMAEIIVCKNRHGPVGVIHTAFRGRFLQFKDLSRGAA